MLFGLFKDAEQGIDVASMSECGPVRKDNQDHIHVDARSLAFCVADGMGGCEGGGEASAIVCRNFAAAPIEDVALDERVRRMEDAIFHAGEEIRAYASAAGYAQMGSTATMLLIDPGGLSSAAVGNVGDSRVYRFRAGKLEQLTNDHTIGDEIRRAAEAAGQKPLADMRARFLSHVLTRAVGIGEEPPVVDWTTVDLREGDVFLLCSDGVHGMVEGRRIASALGMAGKAKDVIARLRELILKGGANDNFSAVVVKVGKIAKG